MYEFIKNWKFSLNILYDATRFSCDDTGGGHLLVRNVRTGNGRSGDPGQRRFGFHCYGGSDSADHRRPGSGSAERLYPSLSEERSRAETDGPRTAVPSRPLRGVAAEAHRSAHGRPLFR